MELFSPEFFSALLAIVVIDLVLAGDNAIVIALAARSLPVHLRNKAIVWGTVGAIVVRTAMTVVVVWLLKIPGLLLIGGLALLWIAYKLLINPDNHDSSHVGPATGFWSAMRTIVIADAVMGLDNVLAVAGAAHGSKLILKFVQRYPAIIYIGAAVLAWTGVKMMSSEPLAKEFVTGLGAYVYLIDAVVIIGVLLAGLRVNQAKAQQRVAANVVDLAPTPAPAHIEISGDILIPVDGSANSQLAVQHVINRFISGGGFEVHLLHVSVPFSRHISNFISRRNREDYYRDIGLQAVQPARDLLTRHNLPHSVHIELGLKAPTINSVAQRLQVDEIVIGTARKNTLTRVLEDSVTSKILETAHVPVEVIVGTEASRWERYGLPAGVGAAIAALLIAAD
jgi:YjbE family integral membrane protein